MFMGFINRIGSCKCPKLALLEYTARLKRSERFLKPPAPWSMFSIAAAVTASNNLRKLSVDAYQRIKRLLYYLRHYLCVLKLHWRFDWRATAQDTHRSFFDTTLCACLYCKPLYIYINIWHATTLDNKLTHLMTVFYIPNDGFTAKDASFYKNKAA